MLSGDGRCGGLMFGFEFGEGLLKMVEARFGRKWADTLLVAIVSAVFMTVAGMFIALIVAIIKFIDYISPVFRSISLTSYLTLASVTVVVLSLNIVIGSVIIFRFVRRTGVSQSALNQLATLRDIGINTLYAKPPNDVQDVSRWIHDYRVWEANVKNHLGATFPSADLSRFTNLGVIISFQFAPGIIVDQHHESCMCSLVKQLDTVEEFLASYRGR
jgi:hypothetical protein